MFMLCKAAIWLSAVGALDANPGVASTAVPVASVTTWIAQLDSESYHDRERASTQLTSLGQVAVTELEAAANGKNPEVMLRSIDVLTQVAVSGEKPAEDAAEAALERLAAGPNISAASMAGTALLRHRELRETRSIEEIRKKGGVVTGGYTSQDEESATAVLLGSQWTGGDEGLTLLKRLPNLTQVSIHGAPISDAGIVHLCSLKSLTKLDLFGADLTDAGVEQIKQALPNTLVERRAGALLGVGGTAGAGVGCYVINVAEDSAAEDAGLRPGDVILTFAGSDVKDFTELTALVGQKKGGEKVALDIFRDGKIFSKDVILGSWH